MHSAVIHRQNVPNPLAFSPRVIGASGVWLPEPGWLNPHAAEAGVRTDTNVCATASSWRY